MRMKKYNFILGFVFCFLAGCAWNQDGTLNYEKTWAQLTGAKEDSAKSAPTEPQDASLISPGKYWDKQQNWVQIKKGSGKNEWLVTVVTCETIHGASGPQNYEGSEEFKCFQKQNIIHCPIYEDCDITLTQIDKTTLDTKTTGPTHHYYGTAGGPIFPNGIYKKK